MSSIALNGTYIDVPAHVIIDLNVPQSIISTLFSSVHNFPQDVNTSVCGVAHMSCSGPVLIPTSDGWFRSRMPFTIKYLMRGNMLLGADWFATCQPLFLHGGILPPSEGVLARLPCGHTWIPASISKDSHGVFSNLSVT